MILTGSSDGSEAGSPRNNETGEDNTTLAPEKRTALSDTQSKDFVRTTPDVVRKVEWDISGSVQYHVVTKVVQNLIACVDAFLKQIAVLPGKALQ